MIKLKLVSYEDADCVKKEDITIPVSHSFFNIALSGLFVNGIKDFDERNLITEVLSKYKNSYGVAVSKYFQCAFDALPVIPIIYEIFNGDRISAGRAYNFKLLSQQKNTGYDYGIKAPLPLDRVKLYILLHEIGHVRLFNENEQNTLLYYLGEYKADQFAHRMMRKHGIPVPRECTRASKRNVSNAIEYEYYPALQSVLFDKMRIDTEVPHEIIKWCGAYLRLEK